MNAKNVVSGSIENDLSISLDSFEGRKIGLMEYIIKLVIDIVEKKGNYVLAISGMPGSGKGTLVRLLSGFLSKCFSDDVFIENFYNFLISDYIEYSEKEKMLTVLLDDYQKYLEYTLFHKSTKKFFRTHGLLQQKNKKNPKNSHSIDVIETGYYSKLIKTNSATVETDWGFRFIGDQRRSTERDGMLYNGDNFTTQYTDKDVSRDLAKQWFLNNEGFDFEYVYSKNNEERRLKKPLTSVRFPDKKECDINLLLLDGCVSSEVYDMLDEDPDITISGEKIIYPPNLMNSIIRIIGRDVLPEKKDLLQALVFRLLEFPLLLDNFIIPNITRSDTIIIPKDKTGDELGDGYLKYIDKEVLPSLEKAGKIVKKRLDVLGKSSEVARRVDFTKYAVEDLITGFENILNLNGYNSKKTKKK